MEIKRNRKTEKIDMILMEDALAIAAARNLDLGTRSGEILRIYEELKKQFDEPTQEQEFGIAELPEEIIKCDRFNPEYDCESLSKFKSKLQDKIGRNIYDEENINTFDF